MWTQPRDSLSGRRTSLVPGRGAAPADRFDFENSGGFAPAAVPQPTTALTTSSSSLPAVTVMDEPADLQPVTTCEEPEQLDQVDDDTVPVADNLPSPDDRDINVSYGSGWSHTGVCWRNNLLQGRLMDRTAELKNFAGELENEDVFLHFFPWKFVVEIVIPQTNSAGGEVFRRSPLTTAEFKVWLGIILQMSLYPGA
eukprot:CAMPEP_0177643832 /NCGR_PEP_ID=MMETSP0447-20121125/8358_1 /TAXON_ID=0 /ORGANISM="Stygamoeba regulata, Strain BSH-02190019" /LENGTH=196 /DNA_ID=CAMNT_0019146139 /DNA_START=166 /DNA_END=752 /DNA_ORIENTATION=+